MEGVIPNEGGDERNVQKLNLRQSGPKNQVMHSVWVTETGQGKRAKNNGKASTPAKSQ